jgi:hypothetical protein
MNPLQPAIDLLIRSASREGTDKYTPAIIILKVAEKVDKEMALISIAWIPSTRPDLPGLRALLESRPEKE